MDFPKPALRVIACFFRRLGILSQWLAAVSIAGVLLTGFYQYYESQLGGPATTVEHSGIRGVPVFHAHDNITVQFVTTRYRTCSLDIGRYVRRRGPSATVGDQDHLIDHVVQQFRGDKISRASFYTANLQGNLPPGQYVVFSYGRYICNLIDHLFLHDIRTDEVGFEIVADDVPIPGAPPPVPGLPGPIRGL